MILAKEWEIPDNKNVTHKIRNLKPLWKLVKTELMNSFFNTLKSYSQEIITGLVS